MSLTMLQEERMKEAVAQIRDRMKEAARRSGRDPREILLCAACKTRSVEEVAFSAGLPIDLFGENHVQELIEKSEAGAYAGKPGHFIGHLQTNKVNKVVGRADLIQSVDSERLLEKIEESAGKQNILQEILLEINIGKEQSKGGFEENLLLPILERAAKLPHVRVRGLMAIPPAQAEESQTRAYFLRMKELLELGAKEGYPNMQMDILSMGMSEDFEWAIEAGATIVRIGTAIYGPRDYGKRTSD